MSIIVDKKKAIKNYLCDIKENETIVEDETELETNANANEPVPAPTTADHKLIDVKSEIVSIGTAEEANIPSQNQASDMIITNNNRDR